ncbi:MAG: phosphatase PAP2 family protein [Stomatobaculum sp.]|nr:phosphatase PAP2 family protein [Stomatobaculum sp.]
MIRGLAENFRPALFQAIFLGFQSLIYFGVEKFEGPPHDIYRNIDHRIPFQPAWVFIYILWFPLIFLFPVAAYFADTAVYARYLGAAAADIVISTVIYLLYPTSFERPVPPDTFPGRLMKIVYSGSYKGVNCMPSMHCSMCYLVIVAAAICPALGTGPRFLSILTAVLIVISTMTTKQHAFLDMASAIPVAAVSWVLGGLLPMQGLLNWLAC